MRELDICCGYVLETKTVSLQRRVNAVVDNVVSVAGRIDIRVTASAAFDGIIAQTAAKQVITRSAH